MSPSAPADSLRGKIGLFVDQTICMGIYDLWTWSMADRRSQIRVYNYNTSEKVAQFEAHPDYIRAIVVHPTQPFILTASDDMTIKLWDWEKGWKNVRIFEGNSRM